VDVYDSAVLCRESQACAETHHSSIKPTVVSAAAGHECASDDTFLALENQLLAIMLVSVLRQQRRSTVPSRTARRNRKISLL
jgi:hypothetical protein